MTEEEKKDPEVKDEPKPVDEDSKSATIADIKRIVPEIIKSILPGKDKSETEVDDDEGDEKDTKLRPSRRTARDTEAYFKDLVEKVQDASGLKELKASIDKLTAKTPVEKKEPEEKPVKQSRSERFWFGSQR